MKEFHRMEKKSSFMLFLGVWDSMLMKCKYTALKKPYINNVPYSNGLVQRLANFFCKATESKFF